MNKPVTLALLLFSALFVQAAEQSAANAAEQTSAQPEAAATLMEKLRVAAPQLPIIEVYATPVAGIFAIDLEGGQTLYGTQDGKHLFSGDLYAVGDGIYNLAEERRAVKRKKLMDAVPREEMVVFSPAGETKDYVSVFTDVDCGYCRKLHQEMADINALGIEVRYLAYPRAGIGTPTFNKIVSAWCAKSPTEAITALKAGMSIPDAQCDNPVTKQYELGQQVGVTGTPAIVTSDGRLLPGYMPAQNLAEAVGLN